VAVSTKSPKLIYVRSLMGLAPSTDAGSVLKAVVFGSDPEDRNAFVLAVACGDRTRRAHRRAGNGARLRCISTSHRSNGTCA